MARLEKLPEPQRSHIAKTKLPRFDTQPWADGPPLNKRQVAIISTAGIHRRDDRPFTLEPGDDYRVIPNDIAANDLIMSHRKKIPIFAAPVDTVPNLVRIHGLAAVFWQHCAIIRYENSGQTYNCLI